MTNVWFGIWEVKIMNSKMKVDELKRKFKNKPFTSKEFYNFYLKEEPNLKETTFRWRVHSLKNDGIIYSPKRGLYGRWQM